MAKKAIPKITVSTPKLDFEAHRQGEKHALTFDLESGEGCEAIRDGASGAWEIAFPWGADRFFGSVAEVKKRIIAAVKKHLEDEAREQYVEKKLEAESRGISSQLMEQMIGDVRSMSDDQLSALRVSIEEELRERTQD